MKVKYCKNCIHYRRGKWTSSYKPLNYHRIGVSHAYGYCEKHRIRCLDVKKCEGIELPLNMPDYMQQVGV